MAPLGTQQILDDLSRRAPLPERTVAYDSDPAQVYDVRLPRSALLAVTVIVVHGGFWQAEYDRAHAAAQAASFAQQGFHVAVVEYRRVGMPGGGWPGTAEDVAAAISAIRADTSLPSRCVLVGHSAGGHLVTWSASQPWAMGLAGAVSLAGCVDLVRCHELGLGGGAAMSLMGVRPDAAPAVWAEADPAALTPAVPVVLLHGSQDTTVPVEVSRRYQAAVRRGGGQHADVRLDVLPGCGHFDLIDPAAPAFEQVLTAVGALA